MTTHRPPAEITVAELLRDHAADMDITVVTESGGMDRRITTGELNRPGLALAGFLDVFTYDRVQLVGNTEMSYLRGLPAAESGARLHAMLRYAIPCLIVTEGNDVPPEMAAIFEVSGVPLLRSGLPTTRLGGLLHAALERLFAPTLNVHGDFLDVFGMGTLIMGRSGVGKSECALELVERGHRLVADDQVLMRRLAKDHLVGRSPEVTKYHMEIRGLGILNVERLFGIAAVSEEKPVELVVWLEKWDDSVEYERLGIDTLTETFIDVPVPKYVIPVQPGRNISIMVEMAALTQRLKNAGVNPAREMEETMLARMAAQQQAGGRRHSR